MKYLLILSTFLIFSCNNTKKPLHCTEYINCKPVNSQLTFGLKGKVKALVEVKTWSSPYGGSTLDSTSVIEFNDQGFVTKHNDSSYTYEYNEKGLLVTAYIDKYMDKFIYNKDGELTTYHRFIKGVRAPEVARVYSYKNKKLSMSEMKDYRYGHDYVAYHTYNNDGSSMFVRVRDEDKYNDTLLYNIEGLLVKSTVYLIPVVSLKGVVDDYDEPEYKPNLTEHIYSDFDEKGNWTSCQVRGYIGESSRTWEEKYSRRIIYK